MNLYGISSLITSVLSITMGLIVLAKNRRNPVNIFWFLTTLSISLWTIGLFGTFVANNERQAFFCQQILYFGTTFIPIFFYHYSVLITGKAKQEKIKIIFGYVCVGAFLILQFSGNLLQAIEPRNAINYWPVKLSNFYYFYLLYFVLYVVLAIWLLHKGIKESKGFKKQQLKYVYYAGLVGYVGGSFNFLLDYNFNYPIGNLFVSLYVFFMAYAILKYRLMNIRFVASKIYTYFFIGVFSYAYFFLIIYVDSKFLGGIYSTPALCLGVIFAIIFARIFILAMDKIQKSSDVIFYRGNNPRTIIKDLSLKLNSVINLQELIDILLAEFKKVIQTDQIIILIFSNDGQSPKIFYGGNKMLESDWLDANKDLLLTEAGKKKIILSNEEKESEKTTDDSCVYFGESVKVVAPLISHDEPTGLIFLGEKIDNDPYLQEDIEFIEIISSQAAAAIANAKLYQEVEDYNVNLQEKVKEQTKDILDKNKSLEKLLVMRSEFLDIASHQLRTPVSVMKGMLSMILDGTVPEEKRKMFLSATFQKAGKLSEIIDDILRASEMDSKKFELDLTSVKLEPIIDEVIQDRLLAAQQKNIQLAFEHPRKPLPEVLSEGKYLKQVIYNLVNNSLQYTFSGYIKVKASVEAGNVAVRVEDTGLGIPAGDLPKMFQKFSRAKNAVDAYTDGSGLGLFIIKQLVDCHQGASIAIEKTELDKGTTFLLKLPIIK